MPDLCCLTSLLTCVCIAWPHAWVVLPGLIPDWYSLTSYLICILPGLVQYLTVTAWPHAWRASWSPAWLAYYLASWLTYNMLPHLNSDLYCLVSCLTYTARIVWIVIPDLMLDLCIAFSCLTFVHVEHMPDLYCMTSSLTCILPDLVVDLHTAWTHSWLLIAWSLVWLTLPDLSEIVIAGQCLTCTAFIMPGLFVPELNLKFQQNKITFQIALKDYLLDQI